MHKLILLLEPDVPATNGNMQPLQILIGPRNIACSCSFCHSSFTATGVRTLWMVPSTFISYYITYYIYIFCIFFKFT